MRGSFWICKEGVQELQNDEIFPLIEVENYEERLIRKIVSQNELLTPDS